MSTGSKRIAPGRLGISPLLEHLTVRSGLKTTLTAALLHFAPNPPGVHHRCSQPFSNNNLYHSSTYESLHPSSFWPSLVICCARALFQAHLSCDASCRSSCRHSSAPTVEQSTRQGLRTRDIPRTSVESEGSDPKESLGYRTGRSLVRVLTHLWQVSPLDEKNEE